MEILSIFGILTGALCWIPRAPVPSVEYVVSLGYSDSVKLNSGYFKDCISAEFSVVLCYFFRLYFRDCYGLISPLSALVYKQ